METDLKIDVAKLDGPHRRALEEVIGRGLESNDDDFDIRETYAAQDAALTKVWDAPALDVYNDYDANKPKS